MRALHGRLIIDAKVLIYRHADAARRDGFAKSGIACAQKDAQLGHGGDVPREIHLTLCVARDIAKAVLANKAVVPVTPEAKFGYRSYRFFPWASRIAARQKLTK